MSNGNRLVVIALLVLATVLVLADFKAIQSHRAADETALSPNTLSSSGQQLSSPGKTESDFYSNASENALPSSGTSGSVTAAPSVSPVSDIVTASAYVVGDVQTGKIYMEKNDTAVLPVASMSKLVTAIAATDTMTPTTTIEVTEPETEVYPDQSNLQPGEKFTVQELLYPLLLDSSNVAAEALASSTDRAHFLNLMNGYAWELGMTGAYFGDPSGLSPHNMASASDFFKLAEYLYLDRPDILAITRTVSTSVGTTTEHGAHVFASIQPFVKDPRFIGGKTGHTDEAADTMLTILNIGGKPIAIIVLHSISGDRTHDTELLASKVSTMLTSL